MQRRDVIILQKILSEINVAFEMLDNSDIEAFLADEKLKRAADSYQRNSFRAGCGLFEYVQIFVISNGTNTKYYSNTTRWGAVKESGKSNKKTKTSNSFEFTSFWADANNRVIPDIVDFTKTFFAKHTILNILTRYCIFTSENLLLVMRPYQIVATERILNRIEIAHNYKKYGSIAGGGYVLYEQGSAYLHSEGC